MTRTRNWWGWGWDEEAMTDEQVASLADAVARRLGRHVDPRPAPDVASLGLPVPRVTATGALAAMASADVRDRALHAYGRSYRDVVRGFHGQYPNPPDLVLHPGTEDEVRVALDWAGELGVAIVPFGGGSSVVGGVELRPDDHDGPWASLDLTRLDEVLEIDPVSRAARIQGGVMGPALEDQLRPHGYTLRHFPQSFEFSTLGGWLATRSGGHYASVYTHIDDLVESMRVVTPIGLSESRRLPGSGAGPSTDRFFLGSEGSLGVITEAWMRLQDRVRWKASAAVQFDDYAQAADAVRAISQSALFPTNCRLLDRGEAGSNTGADTAGLLVLGFESADHPVQAWMERAVEICHDHRGTVPGGPTYSDTAERSGSDASREGAVGAWRSAFVRAPYTRDGLVRCGVLVETFETACTWDRFPALHETVSAAVTEALTEICGGGTVTCRFTHVYPDGPAPYFSLLAPTRFGSEIAMWDEVKAAASEALLAAGGTITHHHAVGRDHDRWYRRQRSEVHGVAVAAAKQALDPAGILNPGVIV